MSKNIALAFLTTSLLASSAFAAPAYDLDPAHSAATFAIKHLGVSTVRGEFGKLSGTVVLDGTDLKTGKVDVTIDAATVNTRQEKRDAHLRSPDFFDVAKFPTITFKSTAITPGANGTFKLTGNLTMHGVTRPITLDVAALSAETKTPFGTTIVATSATGKLDRNDFGVTGGKAGAIIGNEVTITIDLELVKQPAKQAAK